MTRFYVRRRCRIIRSLGTLSNHDDEGSENVAKKMNLSCFKLNRVYLDLLKCQMQATFPSKEEGEFVVICPHPP